MQPSIRIFKNTLESLSMTLTLIHNSAINVSSNLWIKFYDHTTLVYLFFFINITFWNYMGFWGFGEIGRAHVWTPVTL